MKKLIMLLVMVGILIGAGCCGSKEQARKKWQKEYRTKVDYKQSYKQAIDKYSHLSVEELDYAVALAFQQPSDVPIPSDLMAAYSHRHKERCRAQMKEIEGGQ